MARDAIQLHISAMIEDGEPIPEEPEHPQAVVIDGGSVRVRVTLQRVGGKLVLGEPKTDRSRRVIPRSSATST